MKRGRPVTELHTMHDNFLQNHSTPRNYPLAKQCMKTFKKHEVASTVRVIKKGGIFLSTNNKLLPMGQFSIRYQLAPLALILDKAGWLASNGSVPILDLKPTSHNVTSQVFIGSIEEVKMVEKVLATKEATEVPLPSLSYLPVPVEDNNP
jgi:fructose-1,6-bisphosphatase